MPPAATIDTFTRGLEKLIKKFDADKVHYLSKNYVEAQARVDFITPFFKSLGWDVENEACSVHDPRTSSRVSGRPRAASCRGKYGTVPDE